MALPEALVAMPSLAFFTAGASRVGAAGLARLDLSAEGVVEDCEAREGTRREATAPSAALAPIEAAGRALSILFLIRAAPPPPLAIAEGDRRPEEEVVGAR